MTDHGDLLCLGQIVRILHGRETGMYAIVVGLEEKNYVWLADGDGRKYETPKKKNVKHLQATQVVSEEVKSVLSHFGRDVNAKLRYALNQYLLQQRLREQKGE